MPSSGRDFQGAFDVFLALDLTEIGQNGNITFIHLDRRDKANRFLPGQIRYQVAQGFHRYNFQVRDQGGFG